MSLVADAAFLGAALRLDYLRHSHDPHAPRILSVPAAPVAFAQPLPTLAFPLRVRQPDDLGRASGPDTDETEDPFLYSTPAGNSTSQPPTLPLPHSLSACLARSPGPPAPNPVLELARLTDPSAFPVLKRVSSPRLEPLIQPSPRDGLNPPSQPESGPSSPPSGGQPAGLGMGGPAAMFRPYRPAASAAAEARRAARRERVAKLEATAAASQNVPAPVPSLSALNLSKSTAPPLPTGGSNEATPKEEGASASAPFPHPPPGESAKELVASRRRSGSSPVNGANAGADHHRRSSAATIAASAVSASAAALLHRSRPQPFSPTSALAGQPSSLVRRATSALPPSARATPLTATPEIPTEEELTHVPSQFSVGRVRSQSSLLPQQGSLSNPGSEVPVVSASPAELPSREGADRIAYSPNGHARSLYAPGSDLSPPRVEEVHAVAERKRQEANDRRTRWSQTIAREAVPDAEMPLTEESRRTPSPIRKGRQRTSIFGPKLSSSVARERLAQQGPSELSRRLRSADQEPRNPFAALYAGTAARSAASAPRVKIEVYFPWCTSPSNEVRSTVVSDADPRQRRMTLEVRNDATMEEVIGFGLFCYVEEQWAPALPSALPRFSGSEGDMLTTVGWELRMVEDGDVDDDFPALDRGLTLAKFGTHDEAEFAIVPTGPAGVASNKAQYAQIQRRATRVFAPDQSTEPAARTSEPLMPAVRSHSLGMDAVADTPLGASVTLGKSMGAMATMGTMTYLRVLITPSREVRYTTTVQVPAEMYLADVLELICRKRQLACPSEWALVAHSTHLTAAATASLDGTVVIPLDRTVASLQGQRDLALVRRSSLAVKDAALTSSSTDPNAPIFGADAHYSKPEQDLNTIYKVCDDQLRLLNGLTDKVQTWTVNRKTTMFVGRHEQRTLTLDGDWLHITPADMRAFNARMVSYPLVSVALCDLSSKGKQLVKLIVDKDARSQKRHDFEAASAHEALDIVRSINSVRRALGLNA